MGWVSWTRGFSGWFSLGVVCVLLTGCSPKIKGWSQEAYRSPDFSAHSLKDGTLALLPVIVVAAAPGEDSGNAGPTPSAPYAPDTPSSKGGKDKASVTADAHHAYRMALGEALLSKIKARGPMLPVISPGDCLKRINDAGLTAKYLKFDRDFSKVGVDGGLLQDFGRVLGCRYVFIIQAVVAHVKSEASVTVIWTFGRKSVLQSIKISGQIWDAVSGHQVWEGSGVGYNRLRAYEGAPLPEDVVSEAVDRLLETILP